MFRTINIIGTTGVFDTPSFPLVENESLEIKINNVNQARYGCFYITVNFGDKSKIFKLSEEENTFMLSSEWLKENDGDYIEFVLELRNIRGDKVINGNYFIEPLIIQPAPNSKQATAMLQSLRAEIAELKTVITEEKEVKTEILKKLQKFIDNGVDINFEEVE